MTTQPDDNAAARDEAQAAKFRQYLSDQYADDESPTLVLGPEVEFRDAEQLRQWRAQKIADSDAPHAYDDDPEWNKSIANSLDAIERMANEAEQDHLEGRTADLYEALGIVPDDEPPGDVAEE